LHTWTPLNTSLRNIHMVIWREIEHCLLEHAGSVGAWGLGVRVPKVFDVWQQNEESVKLWEVNLWHGNGRVMLCMAFAQCHERLGGRQSYAEAKGETTLAIISQRCSNRCCTFFWVLMSCNNSDNVHPQFALTFRLKRNPLNPLLSHSTSQHYILHWKAWEFDQIKACPSNLTLQDIISLLSYCVNVWLISTLSSICVSVICHGMYFPIPPSPLGSYMASKL
jgi:hypothetical protein